MTRIKICGITSREDARLCVQAGADALGFVFAESARRIDPRDVRRIAADLPPLITLVGVFVDAPLEQVRAARRQARLDAVQLHGKETAEYCDQLDGRVIKRLKVAADDTSQQLRARLDGYRVSAYLLDPGAGDGRTFSWEQARGRDARADAALARELQSDAKERAEHVMLVDVGRDDLGRVCEYGSVQLTDVLEIERHSKVMHLVSNVEGWLAEGRDAFDLFRAVFPAGTVSGAPKVRAMEIIEEFEPVKRGVYAGAIGYFSHLGDMDLCIAIRTIVIADGHGYIQAGAGIVADSVPELEYGETLNKAKALMNAVALAGL